MRSGPKELPTAAISVYRVADNNKKIMKLFYAQISSEI